MSEIYAAGRLADRSMVVVEEHATGWAWRCLYVDGIAGQHSAWHYDKDDLSVPAAGSDRERVVDAAIEHVRVHARAGRLPGRLEWWLLHRAPRRLRSVVARYCPPVVWRVL